MGCSLRQHVTCPLEHIHARTCSNGHPAGLCKKHCVGTECLRSSKPLDSCVFKIWWAWVLVGELGLNIKTVPLLLRPISSNENHSSNGLDEVIRTRCYCDRAHLMVTERSNGRGDDINPLLLWYLCENMTPFTSIHKKRLTIESSPPDPPSTRNHVPLGTHVPTNMHCERKEDSGAKSY
jgi:hypothetical protein